MAMASIPNPLIMEINVTHSGKEDAASNGTESAPQVTAPATDGTPLGDPVATPGAVPAKASKESFARQAVALAAVKSIATSAAGIAKSAVGEVARDSAMQRRVGAGSQLVGYGVAIAANPVLGSIALGASVAQSTVQYCLDRKRERQELAALTERAGWQNRSRR